MIRKSTVALLAVSFLLAGCQSLGGGAPAAESSAAPAADGSDMKQIDAAMQSAYTAPIGQTINWSNPDNGHTGSVVTVKDGYSQQGAYCRQFQKTIMASGQPTKSFDSACQQPDGSWKPAQ